MCGREGKCMQDLAGKASGVESVGIPMGRWEGNMQNVFKK
jgi:hypothetical protein